MLIGDLSIGKGVGLWLVIMLGCLLLLPLMLILVLMACLYIVGCGVTKETYDEFAMLAKRREAQSHASNGDVFIA